MDLICEKAEQLRAVGVQSLEFNGVRIQLLPAPPRIVEVPPEPAGDADAWVDEVHAEFRQAAAHARGRK